MPPTLRVGPGIANRAPFPSPVDGRGIERERECTAAGDAGRRGDAPAGRNDRQVECVAQHRRIVTRFECRCHRPRLLRSLALAAGSSGRLTIGPFRVTRAFVP